MKKQVLCAALAALMLAGCASQSQMTAAETTAAVAAEETAQVPGISLENLEVPDRYTGDFSGVEGLVTVHADAKITLPDADTIPIATVHRRSFTDEDAQNVISYMLGDGEFYKNYDGMTKAEAQAWLERWQKIEEEYVPGSTASDHFTGNEDEDRQHIQDKIAEAEQMLAEAPEEEPREINERTFQPRDGNSEANYTEVKGWGEKDGERVNIRLYNYDDWVLTDAYVEGYGNESIGGYGAGRYTVLDTAPQNCSITRQEAVAIGDGLMEVLGITDMTCFEVNGVAFYKDVAEDGYYPEEDPDGKILASMQGGYELKYTRQVGEMTLTDLTGRFGSKGGVSKGHDGLFWDAEKVTIAVTDEGVVWFDWYSPYTTPQVEETDQTLLSFDEVTDVFERMIFVDNEDLIDLNTRNQMTERIHFDIDEVQLGYIRVREYGNDQDGTFAPVWLFWGTETHTYEGDDSAGNINEGLLFAVNALDGSVIHASWQY